jgi:hypothetical protein
MAPDGIGVENLGTMTQYIGLDVSQKETSVCAIRTRERRAQLIAQLHERAVTAVQDLAARREVTAAEIAAGVRRRKVIAWLIIAGVAFWALLSSSRLHDRKRILIGRLLSRGHWQKVG